MMTPEEHSNAIETQWREDEKRRGGEATEALRCPPWHFLPGPYGDDPGLTKCPNKDGHDDQRREYERLRGLRQAR